jgi:ferric-dicitrate binding protein FerR (iron transport regulator)
MTDPQLIARYLEDQCTEEEAAQVLDWLQTAEGMAYIDAYLLQEVVEVEKTLQADLAELQVPKSQPLAKEAPQKQIHYRQRHTDPVVRIYRAVALTLVLALLAMAFWYFPKPEAQPVAAVSGQVKTNPAGQKSTLFLPDGTKVHLNAASTLRYAPDFGQKERRVFLQGEAFFEVAHDPARSFVVKTLHTETQALGTSFNVKAYEGMHESSISLVEGKVQVLCHYHQEASALLLEPGERVRVEHKAFRMDKSSFDWQEEVGWKEGWMVFKHATFQEVTEKLSVWYGARFDWDPREVQPLRFTGSFQHESLKNILENMSVATNFGYVIEGKTVKIVPQKKD